MLNFFLAIKRLIILASYITALEKLDECKLKILKKNITGSKTKKKGNNNEIEDSQQFFVIEQQKLINILEDVDDGLDNGQDEKRNEKNTSNPLTASPNSRDSQKKDNNDRDGKLLQFLCYSNHTHVRARTHISLSHTTPAGAYTTFFLIAKVVFE